MIRSAEDVLQVVKERGLKVKINMGPPPMPILHKPANVDRSVVTEPLLEALRAWRVEIIEILSPQKSEDDFPFGANTE